MVLSSFFYASYGVWTKLVGTFFGAFTQATLRHMMTSLIFILLALLTRQSKRIEWRRDARWFALSFVSSAIIPAAFYYAFLQGGVGLSSALAYIGIIIGMYFFGWLFVGERYTKDKWLSTALGFLGLGLIFAPTVTSVGWLALIAAVAAGLATGLNVVASKKMPYGALQTAAIVWTLGILANAPLMFIFAEPLDIFYAHIAWVYVAIFALVSVAASWTVIKGVKLIEAGTAGILNLFEIVFGLLFGVLFFNEHPGAIALLGVVAIIAAAAVPFVKDYNPRRGTLENP